MDTALLTVASGAVVALMTHLLSRNHAHRGRDFEVLRDLVDVLDAIQGLNPGLLALGTEEDVRAKTSELLETAYESEGVLRALELTHRRRSVRTGSHHLREQMSKARGHLLKSFLDQFTESGKDKPGLLSNYETGQRKVDRLTEATDDLAGLIRSSIPRARPKNPVLRGTSDA